MNKKTALAIGIVGLSTLTFAYTRSQPTRTVHDFYPGHSHSAHDGKTEGAPEHSGGTDKYGCHNGSVPTIVTKNSDYLL